VPGTHHVARRWKRITPRNSVACRDRDPAGEKEASTEAKRNFDRSHMRTNAHFGKILPRAG
jgi:hypothetical protein